MLDAGPGPRGCRVRGGPYDRRGPGEGTGVGSSKRLAELYDMCAAEKHLARLMKEAPVQSLTSRELELDRLPVTIYPRPQGCRAWVGIGPHAVRVSGFLHALMKSEPTHGGQNLRCDICQNILMPMVALPPALVDSLGDLAVDVREGYESGAWTVTEATSLHLAFTDTSHPRSALVRAIIANEFRAAAGRRGLNARYGQGGAVELYEPHGSDFAVIRLRSAEIDAAGDPLVISNSGSTWGGLSDEGFWREYPYVFGWTVSDNDSVDFFVGEVIGQTETAVPRLEFGWVHRFTRPAPSDGTSFTPDDGDSLDGWDLPDAGDLPKQG